MVEMEYRFNYAMLGLSTILTLLMEWAVFSHVFEKRDIVGGLPKESAFAFVLFGMVIRTVQLLWNKTAEMIDEIREGSFRRYLLQPLNHPVYFFAHAVGTKLTTFLLAVLVCLIYMQFFDAPSGFLSPEGLPQTIFSFFMSCFILWLINLCIVYSSFFLEESQFMLWTLNISIGVFSGTLIPLSWLPESIKALLQWTPFPLLGDWPLRSALGLIPSEEYMQFTQSAAMWALLMSVLVWVMFKKGVARYEAFGG